MRLGLISDTHGLLRPEALHALAGVDHIIHAGDIGDQGIVEHLAEIAPVSAIRGNVDIDPWAKAFPETLTLTLESRRIHVIHDIARLTLDPAREGIALLVFGHSHRPLVEFTDGVMRINPGSAGPRRFRLPVTLATVEWTPDEPEQPTIHRLLP